jgi:hypothetical protein
MFLLCGDVRRKGTPMVTVKEVTTKRALRQFVLYPQKLYRDCPQFVPSMYGDDMANWDKIDDTFSIDGKELGLCGTRSFGNI